MLKNVTGSLERNSDLPIRVVTRETRENPRENTITICANTERTIDALGAQLCYVRRITVHSCSFSLCSFALGRRKSSSRFWKPMESMHACFNVCVCVCVNASTWTFREIEVDPSRSFVRPWLTPRVSALCTLQQWPTSCLLGTLTQERTFVALVTRYFLPWNLVLSFAFSLGMLREFRVWQKGVKRGLKTYARRQRSSNGTREFRQKHSCHRRIRGCEFVLVQILYFKFVHACAWFAL